MNAKCIIVVLCLLMSIIGCHKQEEQKQKEKEKQKHKNNHSHHHGAQYGGVIVELGAHFAHLEIVVKDNRITAYVMDGHASNAIRIEQKKIAMRVEIPGKKNFVLALKAVANELSNEKKGNTSQFSSTNDLFKGAKNFKVKVLSITVKGKTFQDIEFFFGS